MPHQALVQQLLLEPRDKALEDVPRAEMDPGGMLFGFRAHGLPVEPGQGNPRFFPGGAVRAEVGCAVVPQVHPGIRASIPPDLGDQPQGEHMGLYIGAVDDPVVPHVPLQHSL